MTDLNKKAIEIAIRNHFCNVEGSEVAVYNMLIDIAESSNDIEDCPHCVYAPFENLTPWDLLEGIDNLIGDIKQTFSVKSL